MAKVEALTKEQISDCFVRARLQVIDFRQKYGVKCCTDVVLGEATNDSKVPVSVWYNDKYEQFCMAFSNKYLNNPIKKVEKLFIRCFLSLNMDGSFKSWSETLAEGSKIAQANGNKREFQYVDTFSTTYLMCDDEFHPNAYCDVCHTKHEVDLNKINDYSCPCGGSLIPMSSKSNTIYKEKYVEYCTKDKRLKGVEIDKSKLTKEFFNLEDISEKSFERFTFLTADLDYMNAKILKGFILDAYNNEEYEVARMFTLAFPEVFSKCEKQIGKRRLAVIMGNAPAKIERNDFDCEEEDFNLLNEYVQKGFSVSRMKTLLNKAISSNKAELIKGLLKIDKTNFKLSANKIGKRKLLKLKNIMGGFSNELDDVQH